MPAVFTVATTVWKRAILVAETRDELSSRWLGRCAIATGVRSSAPAVTPFIDAVCVTDYSVPGASANAAIQPFVWCKQRTTRSSPR